MRLILLAAATLTAWALATTSHQLSRRKRHVVFPEGSSFSIALCMTVHTLTPDNVFTEGLNWGISYDLPNESKPELEPLLRRRGPGPVSLAPYYLQRRHRRDLYDKIELVVGAMGFDGRGCVLRALCEASQRFAPRGSSLLEEMTRIVFTLPLRGLTPAEPREHHAYAEAHRAGRGGQDCAAAFPRCGFSLVDMALGRYDARPDLRLAMR